MKTVAIIGNQALSLANFRGPLIRDIVKHGHRVIAFAPDFTSQTREAVQAMGAETVDYPLGRTGVNPLQDARSILALRRQLAKIRPDVAFAYFVKPVIYGVLAAWWAGVPRRVALIAGLGFAFTGGGGTHSYKRQLLRRAMTWLYRVALVRADAVVFQNEDDRRLFIVEGTVDSDRTHLIGGTGVDLCEWGPVSSPNSPITFALVARLLLEKGVLEYVEAAQAIKALHPHTRFLLLGGLDENPGALNQAEVQVWVDKGVLEWPGHVDVKPWLAQTSVFVLPSYREGVPRSTQEAMAMGRPVITTDVPGCRETVIDGVNGFMIPPRNVELLVRAMERFIAEPELIERMGLESRRLAVERFDVREINRKLRGVMGLAATPDA